MENRTDHHWRIVDIRDEAPRVKSLYLEAESTKPTFIAGQYLTVKIPGLGPAEGKAYSISSAPFEKHLRITVKQLGNFSSALLALKPDDTILTSAPYGFFYPELDETAPLVFVAGGIGITPILSIIKDLSYRNDQRSLHLFYSNQTEADIAFRGELEELAAKRNNLTIHHFITRQTPTDQAHHSGRITAAQMKTVLLNATPAEYFLCGKMDFTKSLWKDLREQGIKQHQIYTEGFF